MFVYTKIDNRMINYPPPSIRFSSETGMCNWPPIVRMASIPESVPSGMHEQAEKTALASIKRAMVDGEVYFGFLSHIVGKSKWGSTLMGMDRLRVTLRTAKLRIGLPCLRVGQCVREQLGDRLSD